MPPKRKLPDRLQTDPRKMLERLVGLPEVMVLGLFADDERVELHIESISEQPGCHVCGVAAQAKGWREVRLVDLQFAGKPATLHWHKRRWRYAEEMCPRGSWTEQVDRIAHPRMKLTRCASLRATEDVGRKGRSVNEVAEELGCDWHTINDVVLVYGEALVDYPGRFASVEALGLDETAFVRAAPYHCTEFVTSIVDVKIGQLLDLVPGRATVAHGSATPMARGDRLRDSGPLGRLQGRARRLSSPCHLGGRSVSRDRAGQRANRRVPPAHPERDLRAPRAQERPPLPRSAPIHDGR